MFLGLSKVILTAPLKDGETLVFQQVRLAGNVPRWGMLIFIIDFDKALFIDIMNKSSDRYLDLCGVDFGKSTSFVYVFTYIYKRKVSKHLKAE